MQAICDYSSSDSDTDVNFSKKPRLQLPNFSKIKQTDNYKDEQSEHDGRVRSFPHERGNWASFVFIRVLETEIYTEVINELIKALLPAGEFKKCSDLHISLSKTFILRYHWIKTFVDSISALINNCNSISLSFDSLKVYCNEEKTRTFVGFKVTSFTSHGLSMIVKCIDKSLEDWKLPGYYKLPSFHVSVVWIAGDKVDQISQLLNSLDQHFEEAATKLFFTAENIDCKIGNKYYSFQLNT